MVYSTSFNKYCSFTIKRNCHMKNIISAEFFFAMIMFSLRVEADISDYKVMTWNLQGSSAAGVSVN